MKHEGNLFIISGPSAVGKGTICKELARAGLASLSISMTTRKPRIGEIDGKDYYFVSEEEFLKKIKEDAFLEYANVFGNYYGTPKDMVIKRLKQGYNVILEIDVQGGLQVKSRMPNAHLIFILPPTMKELENRIIGRGTDGDSQIRKRLDGAINEIKLIGEYDYMVFNDDLDKTIEDIKAIIKAMNFRVPDRVKKIINKFEMEMER